MTSFVEIIWEICRAMLLCFFIHPIPTCNQYNQVVNIFTLRLLSDFLQKLFFNYYNLEFIIMYMQIKNIL